MRLIDADKLKEVIHCAYSDDLEIIEKIDSQPTVFDVDEVVKELEYTKDAYTKMAMSVNDDVEKMKYIAKEQAMLVAIGIVKGGGIE